MPDPERPAFSRAREHRIEQEVVVDAYNEEERALGWYDYLDDKLDFPFRPKCIAERKSSPLKIGEVVDVFGMAPEDDCMREPFVLIRFGARKLGVPLAQLAPVGANSDTREAIEDWRYWMAMGYEF